MIGNGGGDNKECGHGRPGTEGRQQGTRGMTIGNAWADDKECGNDGREHGRTKGNTGRRQGTWGK